MNTFSLPALAGLWLRLSWPVVFTLAVAGRTPAADFSYAPILPSEGSPEGVIMRGEIHRGDYERLLNFIREDLARFLRAHGLVLASPGGDIVEAMKLGKLVKLSYRRAFVVPGHGACESACFLIYVAAVERGFAANAKLGIHRPFFAPQYFDNLSLTEAEVEYRRLVGKVRLYLDEQEVPRNLIEKMFTLASTEVYWLTLDDLARIGIYANWFDQLLVDRCGLDKNLLHGWLAWGGEDEEKNPYTEDLNANTRKLIPCEDDLIAPEAKANLQRLLWPRQEGKKRRNK